MASIQEVIQEATPIASSLLNKYINMVSIQEVSHQATPIESPLYIRNRLL